MEKLSFDSADGTALVAWRWDALGTVKGRVILVHGVGEHIRRYDYVAGRLAAAGYTVLGINLRGHGESAGKRGHIASWQNFQDDLTAAARMTGGDFFILAHSLGTLVTLDWLTQNPPGVKAVCLSAPVLGIAFPVPWWKKTAANIFSRFLPSLSMDNELEAAEICSDNGVVTDYKEDPQCFHTVTPRLYTELLATIDSVRHRSEPWPWPLQIHVGQLDGLSSFGDIDDFYANWDGPKEYQVWAEGRHEVLNEPFKQKVLDSIIDFFNKHQN